MQPQHTVDRKPEIISPAKPFSTPTSTFNPNATILELILKHRTCFQLQDSEEVAAILQNREEKLKQTITDLRNREDKLNLNNIQLKNQLQNVTDKCASLEAYRENFAAEKEKIEKELNECKAECEVFRDDKFKAKYELEKVRLDLKMWREKEDMAVGRFEKRIAEMEKERVRVRVEIEKVREELEKERGKGKEEAVRFRGEMAGLIEAEESSRYWEKSFKQCEPRVVKLEKDLSVMLRSDPAMAKNVEKTPSLRGFPEINLRSGSTAESPMVDTNGPAETAGPNSSVMAFSDGNRMPTENQVVIEIDDSDDETPIIETASACKTDKDYGRFCDKNRDSKSISKGKRPIVCTQNNGDVGNADGSNKNKKRKMDSAFPNKVDELFYLSDGSISTMGMEKLVSQSKGEMLTAFNKDDELCLNAVCALYRVQKCNELPLASQYRGFSAINATRGCNLAKFLIDGDPEGKLQKSVVELQEYDSKGVGECRKLARNHLEQLFQIYQKEEDTFFKEYLVKNYPKKAIS